MDCSMPGFPVLHYLPELAQTHVHWVSDAIQPSHLLSFPFFCLQSFPASGSFLALHIRWTKYWSFGFSISSPVNVQEWFPLGLTGLISRSPRDSEESSPAPQFKSISSLVLSLFYGPTLTYVHDYWKNHSFDYTDLCQQIDISAFYKVLGRDKLQQLFWKIYHTGSCAELLLWPPRPSPINFL